MTLVSAVALLASILLASPPATAPAAAPSRSPAPADKLHLPRASGGRLTFAPRPVRIPFDLRGNHIQFRGRVNDSDSLWMVLDSGASANVIDAGCAERLGLEVASRGQGRGAGGMVEAGRIASATVRLPGATLDGAPIAAMPLASMERRTGRAIGAILGHPLMSRCVVRIDYAAQTLELLPPDSFEYAGDGAILPLTFENRHPYVTARLTLPGQAPIEGRFVLDLGSSQALILTPTFTGKRHVVESLPRTIEGRGHGLGGEVPWRVGRVPRLELGGVAFDGPVTMLPVSDHTFVGSSETVGNIGGEILRRFTVIFDYPRRRMILEPNSDLREPFEVDMSGINPIMGPADSKALEVEWVLPGSPAEETGVRAGDLIERVDGRPVLDLGIPGLREMLRRPGVTYRLSLRRGDERFEISLTTRRLI